MSTLLKSDVVNYECSCKKWMPLCEAYFCRHCQVLRCKNCVCHEVDSHYCPNCMENVPSAEARSKKNKCANCFDCPSCGHALSTRAASLIEAATGAGSTFDESYAKESTGPGTPRKVFYLMCGFCRWSSREAGIPDQNAASGNWPKYENPHGKLLNSIQENFKQLAAVEKAEKERKKYTKRRSQLSYVTDKYGFQNILTKRRLGLGLSDKESESNKSVAAIEPTDIVETLPDNIFSETLKLEKITTVEQRHRLPDLQPEYLQKLLPVNKQLIVKRSQRCKGCDHNLCKPEFNPSSIKFKMLLTALDHVPEIRLQHPVVLTKGNASSVHLTFSNLAPVVTHVVLLPNIDADGPQFVKADIPVCEFTLAVKDDTADLDENKEALQNEYKDDPNVVTFRRGHKIGIKFDITFDGENQDEIWLSFLIKYDYVNMLMHVTGEQKEPPETVWLQQKVKIDLRRSPSA